ncbi:MAG: hypothetical protein ACUVX8_11485 [Candidatus Zipacnadales bacterium]
MQQKVTPAMVIVALVVLIVIIIGLWYFTMGKSSKKGSQPEVDTRTMQPKTPEEAAAAGYKPQPPAGVPPQGQSGMGGPPSGMQGR